MNEAKEYFPIPVGFHDIKLVALALERLRNGQFVEFHALMQATDWEEEPEKSAMERKFPRIFKEK